MQPSIMRPSPSGPFWWRQTLDTAEMRSPYRNTATRSSPRVATFAQLSGIDSTAQTSTKSSSSECAWSFDASRNAAVRCRATTVVTPAPSTATSHQLVSDCSAPRATWAMSSAYATYTSMCSRFQTGWR